MIRTERESAVPHLFRTVFYVAIVLIMLYNYIYYYFYYYNNIIYQIEGNVNIFLQFVILAYFYGDKY